MGERESVKQDVRGSNWNLSIPLGQQLRRRGTWTWFYPGSTQPLILPPHPLTTPCTLLSFFWLRLPFILPITYFSILFPMCPNFLSYCFELKTHLYMSIIIYILLFSFFLCMSQSVTPSSTSPVSSFSYSVLIFPPLPSVDCVQAGWRRATSQLLGVLFPHLLLSPSPPSPSLHRPESS